MITYLASRDLTAASLGSGQGGVRPVTPPDDQTVFWLLNNSYYSQEPGSQGAREEVEGVGVASCLVFLQYRHD